MKPDPTTSSCTYCMWRFPTADIDEWVDAGRTPLCPRCGVDAVMKGACDDEELERQHLAGFCGYSVLVDALRRIGVAVHRGGKGETNTLVVCVGAHRAQILVNPPRGDGEEWRIRVPVYVVVHRGDASPGGAMRMHDGGLAPGLCAAGFTLAKADTRLEADAEHYTAEWEHGAKNAKDTASVIHAVRNLETRVQPEPDDGFWNSMGDLTSMRGLADHLADIGAGEVTPWGLTLRGPAGHELAVIDSEGNGTVKVYLVLALGFGAKAARKRSESVLAWFDRDVAPAWRDRGFTNPRRGGVAIVEHGGEHRWAVVIDLSFRDDDSLALRLTWARDHGVIAFPLPE